MNEQLWGAIGAVFQSWMSARAVTYRKLHDIPEDWGTAVNVQAMVFGNLGDTSATGVAFTRNPSTGDKELYGEFLVNAQGEDVVAGIRTPQNITEAARIEAGLEGALARSADARNLHASSPPPSTRLEKHYRDMQDLEFTIQDGRLWMLQTRSGKRTAKAALKIAVDMAKEGLISRDEAVKRIDPRIARPAAASDPRSRRQARHHRPGPSGIAGRGVGRDRLRFRRGRAAEGRRPQRHPGARRDEPGRHSRHACRRRHPHHPRRHDLARRRRCARHGQALRLGRRRHPRRLCQRHLAAAGTTLKKGDIITIDGSTGQVMKGAGADHQAGAVRRFRDDHGLGRRHPPHEGARQCRNAARCPRRPRFRRRGHRPLPHRAHVLRCRSHRGDARDDPRRRARRAAAPRSPRSCRCSARISSSCSRSWRACR